MTVGLHRLGKLQRAGKRLAEFGVRIGAGREVAVRLFLLGDDGHFINADSLENGADGLVAGAAERRVNDLQTRVLAQTGIDGACLHRVEEFFHERIFYPIDQSLIHEFIEVAALYVFKNIELLHEIVYFTGRAVGHLAAVAAVALEAVVFRGVVAGGDDDTGGAIQLTDGIAQHGSGFKLGENIHLHAVGGKRRSCALGEIGGLVAGIVADSDGMRAALLRQIIGKRLRRHADGVNIHSVGTSADHASQTAGAEFEITVKSVADLIVLAFYLLEFGENVLGVRLAEPCFIKLHFFVCTCHKFWLPS